jgi:translation initiation factor 4E
MADEIDTRPASAGSRGRPAHATEDDDREEGEIADDTPAPALPVTHPLEHSWTFWFDNPQGKNKQAAWGSSIRPIHTFSTVEDFWGCVPFSLPPSLPSSQTLVSIRAKSPLVHGSGILD